MKSRIPYLFVSTVFLCLFAFSCEKEDIYYVESRVVVRAVPGDGQVKLYFYLCNQYLSSFPGFPGVNCAPDPNAYFDIYQMNPDGTEKDLLARNVTDSFLVEGLPNRVNGYFKLKARVGRTPAAESEVVVVTPGIYAPLERIPSPPGTANVFPYYSPDMHKVVHAFYTDSFSGVEIKQFNPPKTRYAPINISGAVSWDATSRYFMGTTYNYGGSASIYFTVPYLYDTEKDTLRLYNNLGNYDLQVPILAPDQQHIYFLSNEHNRYEYGIWTANLDGSQRRRLAPGFKFTYASPDYLYNQSITNLVGSNDGLALYASFDTYLGNDEDGVYQINPATGDFVRLLDGTWKVQAIQPSPDNQQLVFISTRSGEMAFWLLDLKTGEARQAAILPFGSVFVSQNPIYWADNDHIVVVGTTLTGYFLFKIKLIR
jgi:hypothetical protein